MVWMWRIALGTIALVLVCTTSVSIGLADRSTALPELVPPETGESAPHDAAVVIGIEDYDHIAKVPYARNDAKLFHQLLVNTIGVPTHRISNLHRTPADRELMLEAVEKRAAQVGPDGTLWVYFAGHGAPAGDGGDVYLLGHDARGQANRFDRDGLARSELVALAQTSHAGRVLVVLDACFSGKTRGGDTWTSERMGIVPGSWASIPRVAVWSAVRAGQYAHTCEAARHGVFTYFVSVHKPSNRMSTGPSGLF